MYCIMYIVKCCSHHVTYINNLKNHNTVNYIFWCLDYIDPYVACYQEFLYFLFLHVSSCHVKQ